MPDPTSVDAILVLESALADPGPSAVIDSNVDFVHAMLEEKRDREEFPADALRSYCVDRYATRMRDGGWARYVFDVRWNTFEVQSVREGLLAMDAVQHLQAFEEGAAVVAGLGAERLASFLAGGPAVPSAERKALDAIDDGFARASQDEDLNVLHAGWLRAHPSLCAVASPEAMLAAIRRRGLGKEPDALVQVDPALDRPGNLIRALCRRMGLTVQGVTTSDPAFEFQAVRMPAWRFQTDHGPLVMVEIDGRAIAVGEDGAIRCELATSVIEKTDAKTLDNTHYATNPGNIPVNPFVWARYYPRKFLEIVAAMLFFIVLAIFVAPRFGTLYVVVSALCAAAMPFHIVQYWRQVRDHFRYGCANPAVIVSTSPMLIAVATDLTFDARPRPVIRIVDRPLSTANGKRPEVGARLAMVCLYLRGSDPKAKHWGNVHPQPVDYATTDRAMHDRIMRSFVESDWNELRDWLETVPKPYKPGLYRIGWTP